MALLPRKSLILYIVVQESSVGTLLAQEILNKKKTPCYHIRIMTPNEMKYSPIEKLYLASVF